MAHTRPTFGYARASMIARNALEAAKVCPAGHLHVLHVRARLPGNIPHDVVIWRHLERTMDGRVVPATWEARAATWPTLPSPQVAGTTPEEALTDYLHEAYGEDPQGDTPEGQP